MISGLALLQSDDVGMGVGPSNLRVVSGGVWILREIAFQVQHVQPWFDDGENYAFGGHRL